MSASDQFYLAAIGFCAGVVAVMMLLVGAYRLVWWLADRAGREAS